MTRTGAGAWFVRWLVAFALCLVVAGCTSSPAETVTEVTPEEINVVEELEEPTATPEPLVSEPEPSSTPTPEPAEEPSVTPEPETSGPFEWEFPFIDRDSVLINGVEFQLPETPPIPTTKEERDARIAELVVLLDDPQTSNETTALQLELSRLRQGDAAALAAEYEAITQEILLSPTGVDRSEIDRITEISNPNTEFRTFGQRLLLGMLDVRNEYLDDEDLPSALVGTALEDQLNTLIHSGHALRRDDRHLA